MIELINRLHKDESGQDIIEYVLIAAFITVASLAIIPQVGSKVTSYWTSLNTAMT